MRRRIIFVTVVSFFIFISGCATTRKQANLETQGLRTQVSALQAELERRDEEINSLKERLAGLESAPQKNQDLTSQPQQEKAAGLSKRHPKVREMQEALKAVGLYSGAIDGKMGRQTREAVKAFQRANNLPADGIVGKKTWAALRQAAEKAAK